MLEGSLSATGTSFWKRHRWIRWASGAFLIGVVALSVALTLVARHIEPYLHARLVEALEERFQSRVELDRFQVSFRAGEDGEWGVWAHGIGLRIWPQVLATELAPTAPSQPLIRLDEFSFQAPLRYTNGAPIRLNQVRLNGLYIHIPRRIKDGQAKDAPEPVEPARTPHQPGIRFSLQSVICDHARLEIETSKLPLVFDIAQVLLDGFAPGGVVHFTADLTNPRPRGSIHATGSFGPWKLRDPGGTPLNGSYVFSHADLGTFQGIAGQLSSNGQFEGVLRSLQVQGSTKTPDFHLTHFGTHIPLSTTFQARVDGTTGDTWLDSVDATLGRSHFVAKGQIVRELTPGLNGMAQGKGHDIALEINVDRGHIEDFLRLLSHSGDPLLTGDLRLQTHLHVPPGSVPLHQRMELQGQFDLENAEFQSPAVQQRIRGLSLRGQGRPHEAKAEKAPDIYSEMQSHFTVARGEITLPDLTYTVPGVEIDLRGTYALDGGGLDFVGVAKTQATISQMVGGWKGMLLKPADRFFKRGGAGAAIPIRIGGTRQKPDFAIDLTRLQTTSPQRPGTLPDAAGSQTAPKQ